jgi:cytochrome c oxidase assembly protein subunit 15
MVAYALFIVAGLYAFSQRGRGIREVPSAGVIFLAVTAQAMLGILTLINVVPIDLALAHQLGALIVVGLTTAHLQGRMRDRARARLPAAAAVSGQV